MKVLTKSRYKLSLECFNKLYYYDKSEYANQKNDDEFLITLAEGGFQVEELARMHFPNGFLLEEQGSNYQQLWEQTKELLNRQEVIIYEGAFLAGDLFVRSDVIIKKGNLIELIEVKSKAFDPNNQNLFIGKRGGINSTWKPYLFDITFQKFVIQLCLPELNIKSFLMMADKSKKASVNGLNQMFQLSNKGNKRTGILKKVQSLQETGNSILSRKEVTQIVAAIQNNTYTYHKNQTFLESIELAKLASINDVYPNWPTSFSLCRKCEFVNDYDASKKSGFKECFEKQHGWSEKDFERPNILDIANFRRGNKIFQQGIYFKDELTKEMIGFEAEKESLTTYSRQWLQIQKEITKDITIHIEKVGLKQEINSWNFPLNFIDFETSTVALPFNKGLGPYELVAFQFSHHTFYEDGRIEHSNQYINDIAGEFPNFNFIRALMEALTQNSGTIFRYADHENTVLNQIYLQLYNSEEADKDELMNFIKQITHSKKGFIEEWTGERNMIDLLDVVKKYYYNPLTRGSNSIKDVLPAAIESSSFLKEKYSKPIGDIDITSKNFPNDHIWLQFEDEKMKNPYELLPPVFDDWDDDRMGQTLTEITSISDGAAALRAYGKIQYSDISQIEINMITNSLLKYCELDTLAMVILYEHFQELSYA